MPPIISVEHLSKSYNLGQIGTGTFTNDLKIWWAKMRGKPNPLLRIGETDYGNRDGETIWALKDVSFSVEQGEVLGIIGRNGAGKSTLLKILSRVTAPTSGRIRVKGRVASLLEVGTGFHPDLTGYENIFLNGAILGMSKAEVARKFDEIVDFAEIEKFIDTPVKRYSSGMYVRLAFAVAAHLDPEILVVDEVLAVGDAEFQKKCLGKMGSVAKKDGRTVLFVSHNMASIMALCNKSVVLRNGEIEFPIGPTDEALRSYLLATSHITKETLRDRKDREGEGKIRITGFEVVDESGKKQDVVMAGQKVKFRVYYECVDYKSAKNITAGISINSQMGASITVLSNQLVEKSFSAVAPQGYLTCIIPKFPLAKGSYMLNIIIRQNIQIQDWIRDAVVLNVEDGDFYMTGRLPPKQGGVFIEQQWSIH